MFRSSPDLHLDKQEEWVTPGGAVIASTFRVISTASGPLAYPGRPSLAPTGRRINIVGMDRSEIRDGRLARHQIFYDAAELGRQLGLRPPRNSAAERIAFALQHLTARRMRRHARTG